MKNNKVEQGGLTDPIYTNEGRAAARVAIAMTYALAGPAIISAVLVGGVIKIAEKTGIIPPLKNPEIIFRRSS